MNSERHQQLKAIFEELLAAPPEAREKVLQRRCSGDSALEAEIRGMFAEVDTVGISDFSPVDRPNEQAFAGGDRTTFPPGTILAGRFRIEGFLGSGGMGQVWEAFDTELCERVAIKTIRPEIAADPGIVARFKREVLNARRVTHRNVCRIYDFFVHATPSGNVPFLTMHLLRGETLSELLCRGTPSQSLARRILEDCVAALAAAHRENLIHGDFKPGNVMLVPGRKNGELQAIVTDFGLARYVAEATGRTVSSFGMAGTPAYMAPEQIQGHVLTPAADIYALGIVICETLTGRRPMDGGLELLPMNWRHIVRKAIDPNPARRSSASAIFDTSHRRLRFLLLAVIFLVAMAAFVVRGRISRQPQTIAVLPFVEESGGIQDHYFGEELSDEIIAALSRVSALSVIARNSSSGVDSNLDWRRAAQQLHARYLVTGSVRFVDNEVQTVAQLIDPSNNRILWSQTFERDRAQTAMLHGEIAREVSAHLGLQTNDVQLAVFGLRPPPEAAIDPYMRGRTLWASRSPQNLSNALKLFTESIAIDPSFAAAHAARADTLAIMAERSYLESASAIPQAKEAALHALRLDPELPEAYAALGLVQDTGEWDFYNAEKSFQRAIQLSPSYVYSHQWYAAVLLKTGKADGAIREAETAAKLDPLSPAALANVGWMDYYSQRYDETLRITDELRNEYPRYPDVCMLRADTMIAKRVFSEAIRALASCSQEIKGTPLYLRSLAVAQGLSGDNFGSTSTLNRMLALREERPVSDFSLAAVYAGLNRRDEAFYWLNQGIVHHDSLVATVAVSPFFAPIRTDSRYPETLARIGLPYKK